jgi:hypothetical protein
VIERSLMCNDPQHGSCLDLDTLNTGAGVVGSARFSRFCFSARIQSVASPNLPI